MPVLDYLYPAGGALGSTNTITVSGKVEPWPPEVWSSPPGLTFHALTNQGKFEVVIAPDAPPGPRWVRLYNEKGASEPRLFVIGAGFETVDQEPNDHFAKAQTLESLPITINGRLDKRGDVDCFAVPLKTGQWLEARVDSHTLMSKLDAVLRIVTVQGRQLAWNHDFITPDPRLVWQAKEDGLAVVQIFGFPYPADAQIRLAGGESCVYRLHLSVTEGPPEDFDSMPERAALRSEEALHLPVRVPGAFAEGTDVHEVRFLAHKDEFIQAQVEAAVHGSPLDPWLSLHDESGKELARNDDADGSRDSRIDWTAPADGIFLAKIGSVTHQGGPAYRYTLRIESVLADFRARLTTSAGVIEAGTTQEVKVAVNRLRGFTNELILRWEGLPDGIAGAAVPVPEKGGEVLLALVAGEEAGPHSGPVRLLIESSGMETRPVPFQLTSSTVDNGVPGGYQKLLAENIDLFWLTVRSKAPVAETETETGSP